MGKPTDNSRDITIPTMLALLTVPQIIAVSVILSTAIYSPIQAPLRTLLFYDFFVTIQNPIRKTASE